MSDFKFKRPQQIKALPKDQQSNIWEVHTDRLRGYVIRSHYGFWQAFRTTDIHWQGPVPLVTRVPRRSFPTRAEAADALVTPGVSIGSSVFQKRALVRA